MEPYYLLIGLVLLPLGLGLEITEIMYNPLGSDTGHEWVETYGEPPTHFIEDGGMHTLHLVAGNCLEECISIIAQDALLFLDDYVVSSDVLVYDSSWGSLRNSGETIGVMSNNETVYVTYKDTAALGESLQFEGTWSSNTPTHGIVLFVEDVPEFSTITALCLLAIIGIVVKRKR